MKSKLIILGNSTLTGYTQGGGYWSVYLQYLLGLKSLGHKVFLVELLFASGEQGKDEQRIKSFFRRMKEFELNENCIIILLPNGQNVQTLDLATAFRIPLNRVKELIKNADLFWNLAASIEPPLLNLFRHKVLIDLDPGHLQVSALDWDMGIADHESHLTVGLKMCNPECNVPTLNLN